MVAPPRELEERACDCETCDADGRGRWIPTASVEQYAATLAKWFELPETDMEYVFPNLRNFPTTNLGFMMP